MKDDTQNDGGRKRDDVLTRLRRVTRLPGGVLGALENAPDRGQGLHQWLFNIARQLWPHLYFEDIVALLALCCDAEPREILEAVGNSEACQWRPRNGQVCRKVRLGLPAPEWGCCDTHPHAQRATVAGAQRRSTTKPLVKWPEPDAHLIADIVEDGPGLGGFKGKVPPDLSRFPREYTLTFLERMFSTREDPLLCLGLSRDRFLTLPLSDWRKHPVDFYQLCVPSPMLARTGLTQAGYQSAHSLSGTGPRRFLVIEFDSGTLDAHASLLLHLAEYRPLVLVVFSASKSLHGWFDVQGEAEAELLTFMRYAVRIGADPATWTRSQFVRTPMAIRRDKGGTLMGRQMVKYWNPEAIR